MKRVFLLLPALAVADLIITPKKIDAKTAIAYRGYNDIDGVFVPAGSASTGRRFSDAVCENIIVNGTVNYVPSNTFTDPKQLWYSPLLPSFKFEDKDWTNGNVPHISTVFLLDTGVNFDHPEFQKKLKGDEYVHLHNYVPEEDVNDLHGHGTGSASIIAGTNIGVAKQSNVPVRILSLKVLNKEMRGQLAWILEAIDAAKEYKTKNNGGRYVNFFINLPISIPQRASQIVYEAFVRAYNARIFVVAGAGNKGIDACLTGQAGLYFAITVSALAVAPGKTAWTEQSLRLPSFANHGSCVDVLAPGVNVQVASGKDGYAFMNGTSAATAFATASFVVSGTRANYGNLKRKIDIVNILQDSVCNTGVCAKAFVPKGESPNRFVKAFQNNKFKRTQKRMLSVLVYIQVVIVRWLAENHKVLEEYGAACNQTTTVDFSFTKATPLGLVLAELKEALSGRAYECEDFSLTFTVNATSKNNMPTVKYHVKDDFKDVYNAYVKKYSTDKNVLTLADFYDITQSYSTEGVSFYMGPNGPYNPTLYNDIDIIDYNFGQGDSQSDIFPDYNGDPIVDPNPPPPPVWIP